MKTLFRIFAVLLLAVISVPAYAAENLDETIEQGLARAREQSLILAENLRNRHGELPRSFEDGRLVTSDYRWWCSGFFPGVLWQLYQDNGDGRLREYAELFTDRCEPAKNMKDTHDLGFMLYCSFGKGYDLTGDSRYLDVLREGSESLMTRFDPELGLIKSWESGPRWKYPVIIDNMMNLEMLCFATRMTNDRRFVEAAKRHADNTMKNHFRDDFSTFHLVSYDPADGKPHIRRTVQGYADGSAWARGQAWGLYGYTMMYRETLDPKYLEQARRIATFLVSHPRLPDDGIPYWDFDADDIPNAPRDASAGAVMASALIELSQLDPTSDAVRWLNMAEKQIRSLSSPAYLADKGELGGFILKHSVGSLPGKSEIDVPLTYADYYYVEALMRMKNLRAQRSGMQDRDDWVAALEKIARPVLFNLSAGTLKSKMPFESLSSDPDRKEVSYLEALGRTICGIAPWLELGPDSTREGRLRAEMTSLALKSIANAVDSTSADYLRFTNNRHLQPLVDAAFLAQGLLRAPTQLWGGLGDKAKEDVIRELKRSRSIRPYESNWLLFASIIEAALLEFDGDCDEERMMYGVEKFRNDWYKGDGWYGDGPGFHLDYYNSLVIHPMLTEVLMVIEKHKLRNADFCATQKARQGRYAEQLERMISPEGTYPVTGRSITYRFGSLHAMSHAALLHILPEGLNPAQVRTAMTAVIRRQLSLPGTFDREGWLRVGFTGPQIKMSEDYINTGSEYLICAGFCALGLPPDDAFWANPYVDWSGRKAWNNIHIVNDHVIPF